MTVVEQLAKPTKMAPWGLEICYLNSTTVTKGTLSDLLVRHQSGKQSLSACEPTLVLNDITRVISKHPHLEYVGGSCPDMYTVYNRHKTQASWEALWQSASMWSVLMFLLSCHIIHVLHVYLSLRHVRHPASVFCLETRRMRYSAAADRVRIRWDSFESFFQSGAEEVGNIRKSTIQGLQLVEGRISKTKMCKFTAYSVFV